MKWEYKFVIWQPDYSGEFKSPSEYQETYLNEMGMLGWELCGVVAHEFSVYNFFFKRKLP